MFSHNTALVNLWLLTKCDIPILHPCCNADRLIGSKSSPFLAREQIPNNSRLTCVVADHILTGPVTDIVHRQEQNPLFV